MLLRDGRPHLPATALKGMLRAAYEAITNSRFGVFNGHDDPLGWRRVADDARHMYPVRVSADGKSLEFWEAVKFPSYPKAATIPPPEHGERVWVKTTKEGTEFRLDSEIRTGKGWEEGFAFITGQNAEKKHDERVFVRGRSKPAPLTDELRERWEALMDHYRRHEQDIESGGELEISPHRKSEERRKLTPETFCWAYKKNGRIEALYPVMIPRDLAIASPAELVPPKVEPAASYRDLSPADRVFGWVAQEGSGTRPAAYRGRVRVNNITCVTAAEKAVERFSGKGLPLAILAQPKPTQSRFYLSESAAEPNRPIKDGIPKNDVHRDPDRALRGRKIYWHHRRAAASASYWTQPSASKGDPTQQPVDNDLYREYRRPNAVADERLTDDRTAFQTTGEPQRDKQNRSVRGWIARDTEFTFSIGVRDIPEVELGALLWLLTLGDDHHHRLGLGKPLGFGSVHLSLDLKETELHTGAQWSEYYRDLMGELPGSSAEATVTTCIQAFVQEASNQPGFAAIESAFRAAARGKHDLPVHYPRARPKGMRARRTPPNPAGESYAWFTANEKLQGRDVAPGRGRSLPSADASRGSELVVYDEEQP
ncbi:TIGR03986 family type III CRISPR-associated RAMP protein [Actinomadura terrae]|uniref:TIGR03986 family type III CRISPR-associated RAMP protein n=1 Tax=Actinomadura terrae TaxID=604353 RepID=UPI001FA6AE03|nr:TIGR03986 family CRISPR-associated RAMP protein [Actinomadura terrae]